MKIITLVENTSISSKYRSKHGLSFYIETREHRILFDIGQDALFIENAKHFGIKIEDIDTVIISHGHKDHAGALELFLEKNKTAKVYIRQTAFKPHYTKLFGIPVFIGLDNSLKNNEQIVFTSDSHIIDNEIQLFSGVTDRSLFSDSNNSLFVKSENGLSKDGFEHEQYLIVTEDGKSTMFGGCAHNGIANIMTEVKKIIGYDLTYAISGFHLYNPISKKMENEELIKQIGKFLKSTNTKYSTCHCTGEKAFGILKDIMDDQISYMATGSSIEI